MVCCQTKDVMGIVRHILVRDAHAFGKSRITLGSFYSAVSALREVSFHGLSSADAFLAF